MRFKSKGDIMIWVNGGMCLSEQEMVGKRRDQGNGESLVVVWVGFSDFHFGWIGLWMNLEE